MLTNNNELIEYKLSLLVDKIVHIIHIRFHKKK